MAVIAAPVPLAAQPAEAPTLEQAQQCGEFRDEPPRYRPSARPSDSGWVLFEYDLDGSGRASNIKVLDNRNAGAFAREVVREISAPEFKKRVVKPQCREVPSRL
jgi:hypothetical protein